MNAKGLVYRLKLFRNNFTYQQLKMKYTAHLSKVSFWISAVCIGLVCMLIIVSLQNHHAYEGFKNEQKLPVQDMKSMLTYVKSLPNLDNAKKTLNNLQIMYNNMEPMYYSMQPKLTDTNDVINILWSGGLASTYRMCQLLFIYKRKVRPVFFSQRGLDFRDSTTQETVTVNELHKYIHRNYPETQKLLLPTEVYNTSVKRNLENKKHIETLAYVFQKPEHMISPFYVALRNVHQHANVPHSELSERPLELVLPKSSPHSFLRRSVEKWGQPVVFHRPDASSAEKPIRAPDERLISKCMYFVPTPNITGTPTDDQKRQNAFANYFQNIRFILPCETSSFMHATAHYYKFKDILKRTWSCIHPQMTRQQKKNIQNKKNNKRILLYTVPIGSCGTCASCRQRAEDGFARVSN